MIWEGGDLAGAIAPADLPLRDRVGVKHDGSELHRRWSMRNYCPACEDEFEERTGGAW